MSKQWSVEPHGNGLGLYFGRDKKRHGLRLMDLVDGDMNFEDNAAHIVKACNLYDEFVEALQRFVERPGVPPLEADIVFAKAVLEKSGWGV